MTVRSNVALLSAIALAGSATMASAESGAKFSAKLRGAAEVPGPGDPDGKGSAAITINPGKSELCYKLTVKDIAAPTAAHLHTGSATQAGPVSVGLTAPAGGSSSGCVTINNELVDAIRKAPQAYYVNVHNAEFPDGAIRGQLDK
jgi:hypothetical protein